MSNYGHKIKQLRESKGISQKQVADEAGIKPSSYFNIEKGNTQNISIEVGKGIARALGVSFDELFDIESGKEIRSGLLDRIDELEKELKKSEMLLNHFSKLYKALYIKNLERDFDKNFRYILQLKFSLEEYDNEETRSKLESQIKSEKYFLKHTISEIKGEGLITDFEILEMLYKFDPEIDSIIENSGDISKELSDYWNEFMEISQSRVEQFLFWYNKRLENENRPVRS